MVRVLRLHGRADSTYALIPVGGRVWLVAFMQLGLEISHDGQAIRQQARAGQGC